VTELLEFQRCPRMWDWTSPSRKGLARMGSPAPALHIGTGVHLGLEANAVGLDWRSEMLHWFEQERAGVKLAYKERVGVSMSDVELKRFGESEYLIWRMLEHYFERFGVDNPIKPFRYVIPELTFSFPFPVFTQDGRQVHLVGTFDGVARDEYGDYWIVENKTFAAGGRAERSVLETDHQMLGYVSCLSHLLGIEIAGLLYNGLAKVLPATPDIRKTDGRVSRAAITTTYARFRQALVDNGQDPDDSEYRDLLAKLQAQGKTIGSGGNPFWCRYRITYPQEAREAWMVNAYEDLQDIVKYTPTRYVPYRRLWEGCYFCPVEDLCRIQIRGGNLDAALRNFGPSSYGTRLGLKLLAPDQMTCPADLERIAEKRVAEIRERGHLLST
jgi:PD-(D/E)XK nuclease superfamily